MNALVADTEPVLVVHGIGNRDAVEFGERVAQLETAFGPRYKLIPVHWGELGGSYQHLDAIMPARPSAPVVTVNDEAQEVGFWDAVFGGIANLIEQGAASADEALRARLRAGITANVVPYLGDIIVYQGLREQFHRTVRSYLPSGWGTIDRPIKAIGHSLGGVMLFDLAVTTTGTPVWFSHLVTLGSQAPFFHLQHRRSDSVREYAGQPVTLPPMVGAWTNVMDDDDWLSFAAEPVFKLQGGGAPRDCWVDNTDGSYWDVFTLAAHSGYWTNPAVHHLIREAFGG